MKTNFVKTAGLVSLFPTIIFNTNILQAQPERKQGPPPIPNQQQIEKMVTDLSKELSLDESQQQVSEIFVAHFNEMKEVQEKYKNSHEAERKEMDVVKTEFDKEMKTVLTKDQQKEFDTYMKKKHSQKGEQGKPRQ
jgi:Spy/CpxP family protein refolding chaperone